ncbi:uncharacterized protein RSE6_06677 [Rhynchosporium secalis]|uniref:Myb-like DNA-binding domain-containing protein n=1 Tax=Rhynchosporium secalis TaxID=38038 RepID=A0A1E1MB44_RHYSE|nr:uncharacterized protein RSE6_06677 [Rhynchosporium secalis]
MAPRGKAKAKPKDTPAASRDGSIQAFPAAPDKANSSIRSLPATTNAVKTPASKSSASTATESSSAQPAAKIAVSASTAEDSGSAKPAVNTPSSAPPTADKSSSAQPVAKINVSAPPLQTSLPGQASTNTTVPQVVISSISAASTLMQGPSAPSQATASKTTTTQANSTSSTRTKAAAQTPRSPKGTQSQGSGSSRIDGGVPGPSTSMKRAAASRPDKISPDKKVKPGTANTAKKPVPPKTSASVKPSKARHTPTTAWSHLQKDMDRYFDSVMQLQGWMRNPKLFANHFLIDRDPPMPDFVLNTVAHHYKDRKYLKPGIDRTLGKMKPAEAYAWFITTVTHENKLHDEGIFGGYGGTAFPLWRLIGIALRRCIDDQRRLLKAGISTTTIPQELIHTELEDTKREELEKEQKKEEGTEGVTNCFSEEYARTYQIRNAICEFFVLNDLNCVIARNYIIERDEDGELNDVDLTQEVWDQKRFGLKGTRGRIYVIFETTARNADALKCPDDLVQPGDDMDLRGEDLDFDEEDHVIRNLQPRIVSVEEAVEDNYKLVLSIIGQITDNNKLVGLNWKLVAEDLGLESSATAAEQWTRFKETNGVIGIHLGR